MATIIAELDPPVPIPVVAEILGHRKTTAAGITRALRAALGGRGPKGDRAVVGGRHGQDRGVEARYDPPSKFGKSCGQRIIATV